MRLNLRASFLSLFANLHSAPVQETRASVLGNQLMEAVVGQDYRSADIIVYNGDFNPNEENSKRALLKAVEDSSWVSSNLYQWNNMIETAIGRKKCGPEILAAILQHASEDNHPEIALIAVRHPDFNANHPLSAIALSKVAEEDWAPQVMEIINSARQHPQPK